MKHIKNYIFFGLVLFCCGSLFAGSFSMSARLWNRHLIPGTKCGNGETFAAFIDYKNPKKIAVKLHGGNACWSPFTCHGPFDIVNLAPHKSLEDNTGFTSVDPSVSPVSDFTVINIPYCTADVHLGDHTAQYDGKPLHHSGMINIINTVNYFMNDPRLDWNQVEEFTLMGTSAGAVGALYHLKSFEPYISHVPKKSMILDAPGLHWGNDFWYKFTWSLVKDYSSALNSLGYNFDLDRGTIADAYKMVCELNPEWNIGAILSSKDWVMSAVFGNISKKEHHKKVFSHEGIYGLTASNKNDNCSAWIAENERHQYLDDDSNMKLKVAGLSARDYINKLIKGEKLRTYRGKSK